MNIKSYEMLIKIENAIREFIFDFASKTNIFLPLMQFTKMFTKILEMPHWSLPLSLSQNKLYN